MLKRKRKNFVYSLIIIFVLGLVPLLWFKGGYLIKSEDVGLPLNFSEWMSYTYAWFNQRATGTYPIDNFSALFFLFIPAILQKIGLSLLLAQKIHFIFWFMMPGFALFYLLLAIFDGKFPHPLIVLTAVGFYMFNLYLEPVWLGFSIANLSAYTALPFLMGFFINGLRTKKFLKYISLSGLIAILLSGIGVNPPIAYVCLVIFGLWVLYNFIFLVLLKREVNYRKFLKFLLLFALVIILVNAFWIYPQGMRYLKSAQLKQQLQLYRQSVEEGYQGIMERSKYTSLLNVLKLQGAWTWYEDYDNDPYVLYSERYQKSILFLILSILPVTFAFLSIFNLKRTKYALFFIFMALIGIMFSVGMHHMLPDPIPEDFNYPEDCSPAPLSFIYKFFLNVPGFWIVRSPWYKWTLLTVLGLAVMIGVSVKGLLQKFKNRPFISKVLPVLLFLSIMLYAYPIIIGSMFTTKEQRTYVPSNLIKIPQHVYKASEWLSEKKDFFRIMILPSMQRRITYWGYTGYEPVVSYFTEKPIITPVIEGTFGSAYSIPNIDNLLYNWLYINVDRTSKDDIEKKKNAELQKSHLVATKILPFFNIGYLLHEQDVRWDFYDKYESPDFVRNKLALQEGISLERSFGKWDFYKIESKIPHIYATKDITLIDGGIEALEPLSRTDFFDYNLVFKSYISSQALSFLEKQNIFDSVIYYNCKDIPNEQYDYTCLLLSTEDNNIFYKKEVLDRNLKDKLKISFVNDTFIKDKQRYWMEGLGLSLEVKIINETNEKIYTNLKFSCSSFKIKRGLYVYLNDSPFPLHKTMLDADEDMQVKLKNLELEPGENILSFRTNQESILHKGFKRGISFKNDFVLYLYEFNTNVKIPSKGPFYVYLYPYPINDINFLPPLKQITVNHKIAPLKFNDEKIEYARENAFSFNKSFNSLKFIRNRDENYYLLIVSKAPKVAQELINVEVATDNPVRYILDINQGREKSYVLILNESFDENWRAYYLISSGRYEEIKTHFIINGYANAWCVNRQENDRQSSTVMLKYVAQNQFWIGITVATPVFLFCTLGCIFSLKKRKKEKNLNRE